VQSPLTKTNRQINKQKLETLKNTWTSHTVLSILNQLGNLLLGAKTPGLEIPKVTDRHKIKQKQQQNPKIK
jgi:hypothetical protein